MGSLPTDSILDLIRVTVHKFPNHTAVDDGLCSLTYEQLDKYSSAFACHLKECGARVGQVIPLVTSSCSEMVVGVVAILKAGGVYVPIDYEQWPQSRTEYVLSKVNDGLVVYTGSTFSMDKTQVIHLSIPNIFKIGRVGDQESPPLALYPELMCVIFTSGTTDRPKGVRLKHSAVCHLVSSRPFNYDVTSKDLVLLVLSVAFDACMATMFSTLCNGGTLIIATKMNFPQRARRCTVLVATPSILEALAPPQSAHDYPHLDRIILGGETAPHTLLEAWSSPTLNICLWVAYGPTEATCSVLTGQLKSEHLNPTRLGICIPGSKVWLVSHDGKPIEACEEEGEIYISGPCLADGYWRDEEKTREKFIMFQGQRTYRTGDLARWTVTEEDQCVVDFCGRQDRVVKIRGFLVNLEQDVDEGILRLSPDITKVFSLLLDGRLCTAVVSCLSSEHILSLWRERAPAYMVPTHVLPLEGLPLSPNGKVDARVLLTILKSLIPQVSIDSQKRYESVDSVIMDGLSLVLQRHVPELLRDRSLVAQGIDSLTAAKLSSFCRRHGYETPIYDILIQPTLEILIQNCQKKHPIGPKADDDDVQSRFPGTSSLVTPLQKRLILESLEDKTVNCLKHVSYYRSVDIPALKDAWRSVVAIESLFQTEFDMSDGIEPRQRLTGQPEFSWQETTVASPEAIERALWEINVTTGLKSKFHVLHCLAPTLPSDESILVWSTHHALIDGFSASLILQKVDTALQGKPLVSSPPFVAVAQEMDQVRAQTATEAEAFWQQQADQFPEAVGVPLLPDELVPYVPSASVDSAAEHAVYLDVDRDQLSRCALRAQCTPAAIFYAAWALLLSRYTSSDEVIFGAVLSGRGLPYAWAQQAVGPLLNTLPIRCSIDRPETSSSFLSRIHRAIQTLSNFHVAHPPAHSPRFATALVIQDGGLQLGTQVIEPVRGAVVHERTSLPLTVIVEADSQIRFLYQCDKFSKSHIHDMASIYVNLVRIMADKEWVVQKCLDEQFPPTMKERLLVLGNQHFESTHCSEQGHTLTSLFLRTAAANGDVVALEKNAATLTYSKLAEDAARVAGVIKLFAAPGDVVAVLADRSINWIVGVFAAIMANTIYCPCDASYPPEYRMELLGRSRAKLLLLPNGAQMEEATGGPVAIAIDQVLRSKITPCLTPGYDQKPSDAAYMCFTSGSTGSPKGVVCEHRGVVAYQSSPERKLFSRPGIRIAQFLAPGFDCSVQEIFASLCYGATLVLRTNDYDPYSHLTSVDVALLNASVADVLDPSDYPNLAYLYFVGEPVGQKTADCWSVGRELYNAYGPTEATIVVCQGRLQSGVPPSVGRPAPSVRLYILNDRLELQPPNTVGNVFVAGVQVARGYLDMPDATAKTFLADPFVPWPGERMYRTGDLGFWDNHGSVRICGREDRQIKVGGRRANLDDISSVASRATQVKRSVALIGEDGALVLWVEPDTVDVQSLRHELRARLPPHALPSQIKTIKEFPQSKNGKVDIKSLRTLHGRADKVVDDHPMHEQSDKATTATTERNNTANTIFREWRKILGQDSAVAEATQFKLEGLLLSGGDSLAQLAFASRIRTIFNIPVTVRDIIYATTAEELALTIEAKLREHDVVPNPSEQLRLRLPLNKLSSAEMMWVRRYQQSEVQTSFNIPYAARLPSTTDLPRLVSSLQIVLNRHRVLRSQFQVEANLVERFISEKPIEVKSLLGEFNMDELVNQPFDIGSGNLVTVVVSPASLFLNISHVVCDLTTMSTLLAEVTTVYHGHKLAPVTKEYFDMGIWSQTALEADNTRFWSSYFSGLAMPRTMTEVKRSYRGTSILTTISNDLYHALQSICAKDGGNLTLHQCGLAITGMVLHTLCDRDDVVIGSPYINRPSIEDRQVVGLFLEPLPVRIAFEDGENLDVHDLLQRTKKSSQSALAHAMPWSILLQHLQLPSCTDAQEIFGSVVTFHDDNSQGEMLAIDGIVSECIWAEGAKFPMLFEWHARRDDRLTLRIEYDTDHFRAEYVQLVITLLLESFQCMLDGRYRHRDVKMRLRACLERESLHSGLTVEEIRHLARMLLMGI